MLRSKDEKMRENPLVVRNWCWKEKVKVYEIGNIKRELDPVDRAS